MLLLRRNNIPLDSQGPGWVHENLDLILSLNRLMASKNCWSEEYGPWEKTNRQKMRWLKTQRNPELIK